MATKIKKVDVEVEEAPKKKAPKNEYRISIKVNDKKFEIDTNDIADAIKSVEQEFIKTKFVFQITKDGKTLDRLLYANDAKKLFYNRYFLESFIKNLIF